MSSSFLIEDINKKGCITVNQALNIGEDFTQYVLDESHEEYDKFLEEKIDNFECILLGIDGKCARGFELSYDNKSCYYGIRIFSPSSSRDYLSAFEYIKKLCIYLENDNIISEDSGTYKADNIDTYNYIENIMYALKVTYDNLNQSQYSYIEIEGLYRPVALDKKIIEDIINSADAVESFSSFITDLQYIDAYSASQMLFKDEEGAVLGAYTITETVDTIIPFAPCVEYKYSNIVENSDISKWLISLVVINGDADDEKSYNTYGYIEHNKFIEKLPKDKYYYIDAKNILIKGLTRQEIENIAD